MLTEWQLKMYAEKWLMDNYGMKLTVPLKLNGRLKTTCGRFVYIKYASNRPNEPKIIELNKYFFENNEPIVVLDVLRHELIHYALFMLGKPHRDGHPVFENELKRLGVVSQETIDKYNIKSKPVNISVYECLDCNHEYKLKRALRNEGRNHRCTCGGRLKNLGKRLVTT
ncbi:SprT-like family protein [Bacillus phage vB_BcoS-136]|uniref:SprT-like family protein n=1 Tax=Bacillus phage vB_BcoS-136 TaxID=2419619 RepID=A0A3G3BVG8_9CAUD|nr:SprT-like family protein [Bacillus phage vB_BcoS-136]AYP68141.1 SprT-like family protein [Bacillus phage vB_BcoS-136]